MKLLLVVCVFAGCTGAVEPENVAVETPAVDAGTLDASVETPDAGACGAVILGAAPSVSEAFGAAPATSPGALQDGTYTLTALTRLSGDQSFVAIRHVFTVSGERMSEAISITQSGQTFEIQAGGALTVTGDAWRFTAECPGPQWNANGTYSWDGATLVLSSESNGGTVVSSYSRSP